MGAIINAQGIYKEDVFDKCSSASTVYASVWAEKQGKNFFPWIPSLSSSVAVLAGPEDPPQQDRHSASAIPRVFLSSKVVLPAAPADSKKQTRFASPPVTRRPRLASHVSLLTPRRSGPQTGSLALRTRCSTRS